MENISLICQIFVHRNQIKDLEKQKHSEIWNQFTDQLTLQIYKDLCARIPETKEISVQQLFNKTIHPNQNKEELLFKYANLRIHPNRMNKIRLQLNDFWVRLGSIWLPVEIKYEKQILELKNQLSYIDSSPDLEHILNTFNDIIENSKSVKEVEDTIKNFSTTQQIMDNLLELLEFTKNILEVHYELQ